MKKNFTRALAIASAAVVVLLTGCQGGHEHEFTKRVAEDKYLKEQATCTQVARYYYSCECGAAGEKVFAYGQTTSHDYSAEVAEDKYLKKAATCQNGAEYFKSCVSCGQKTYKTFYVDGVGEHSYTKEVPDGAYIKDEATEQSSAVYYKTCACGKKGTETFSYGEPLREYSADEKIPYTPTSLTVTMYDTENSVYGFTYNTSSKPLRPVIQIAKAGEETYQEYPATVEQAFSFTKEEKSLKYYIVKTEVELEASQTYTYRAYDKYVDVGTEYATLKTMDESSTSFSFAHVSDSQMSVSSGKSFGTVLSHIVGNNDFIVHTGDVVEWSKYESEWTDMLHSNFSYLSQIPMMAISGNHETTYRNGTNETYKHFHNKMPEQDTTLGYYYSFTYGNAKFIMLNTNRLDGSRLTEDQYDWLVEELENNTATWTIVSMHNPMYSPGNYGADPSKNSISLALRRQLQGIFAEYGVDIVLQGHDHVVSRTRPIDANGFAMMNEDWEQINGVSYTKDPDGVLYLMNGPAGTQTRAPYGTVDTEIYHYALQSSVCSWAEFEIDGNMMTVTVKYAGGSTVSEYKDAKWGIIKSAA